MSRPRVVIFDLDGTLTNTSGVDTTAFAETSSPQSRSGGIAATASRSRDGDTRRMSRRGTIEGMARASFAASAMWRPETRAISAPGICALRCASRPSSPAASSADSASTSRSMSRSKEAPITAADCSTRFSGSGRASKRAAMTPFSVSGTRSGELRRAISWRAVGSLMSTTSIGLVMKPTSESEAGIVVLTSTKKFAVSVPRSFSCHASSIFCWIVSRMAAAVVPSANA